MTPIPFRFPNSVSGFPSVSSGLRKTVITELIKEAEAPLINWFLTVVIKGVSNL